MDIRLKKKTNLSCYWVQMVNQSPSSVIIGGTYFCSQICFFFIGKHLIKNKQSILL